MVHVYLYEDTEKKKRDYAWQHEMGRRLYAYARSMPENEKADHFSISHSGGYVAVALSDMSVGVDIETKREVSAQVMDRAFSETEQWFINSEKYALTPIQLWTLKESYGKSWGCGIAYPLKEVEFAPATEDSDGAWKSFACSWESMKCCSLTTEDFVLTVCVRNIRENYPRIQIVTKQRLDMT